VPEGIVCSLGEPEGCEPWLMPFQLNCSGMVMSIGAGSSTRSVKLPVAPFLPATRMRYVWPIEPVHCTRDARPQPLSLQAIALPPQDVYTASVVSRVEPQVRASINWLPCAVYAYHTALVSLTPQEVGVAPKAWLLVPEVSPALMTCGVAQLAFTGEPVRAVTE
jgi:hypothetical protein